ncbi:MAG: efflux RND transporter periplasmic adaptor subunit [Cystobacterineae bacterium]|nr:efflux RND transporter periplasmic adaptor subunit [Cystobacterineae bacterium]
MKWWKRVILILIVGFVGVSTWKALGEKAPVAVSAQLVTVKRGPITRTVVGTGKLEPSVAVKLSSSISGDLISLNVKAGDLVKKGQVLGKIDPRRYDALVKQTTAAWRTTKSEHDAAKVELERTQAELARTQALFEKGLSSKAEYEKILAEKDSAQARFEASRGRISQSLAALEEAQTDFARTTLYSPIDGTVIQLSREVGERVRGSDLSEDVVMTIATLSSMEVKIEVAEREVVFVKPGQKASITVDALEDRVYEGQVLEVAQKALIRNEGTDNETIGFPVRIGILNKPEGGLTGMSAEVKIDAEHKASAWVVPIQAVTVRPEGMLDAAGVSEDAASRASSAFAKVVFVVGEDMRVRPLRVRTGIASETEMELVEGAQEGMRVVEGPYRLLSKELKEGDLIKDREQDKKTPGKSSPKPMGLSP